MPIINIQRRMSEQGRIRLGRKVATSNGRSRPEKLDRFRFTSTNERIIQDIAALYGGTPQPWDNAGKSEFEVFTEARSIPVIVVRGGFSQWMETWSGGGCTHRCDSERQVDGTPCNPEDPNHINAKATTRLSVMLRDIETLGVFRLESHGWNAAAELPMLVEIAQQVGDLVPASLNLDVRKSIKDGKTSRYVVPVLDLEVSKARLVELVGGVNGAPQIAAGGGAPQIAAAPAPDVDAILENYQPSIDACATTEALNTLWREIVASEHLYPNVREALIARGAALQAAADAAAEPQPNDDGTYDADVVDDPGAVDDAAWMEVVSVAGQHGWTTDMLMAAFEQWAAVPVDDGTAQQFRDFLAALRRGDVDAPSAVAS